MSLAAADPLASLPAAGMDALWKNLAALLLTCLLAVLVLWLLRRGRGAMPAGAAGLRLLSRLPLSEAHTVYLIDASGRYLLLGGGPGGLSLLTEVDAERLRGASPAGPAGGGAEAGRGGAP